jgi:hypothetical protein
MKMSVEFFDSVLCDECNDYDAGVVVHGWAICLRCVRDDVGLLEQAIRVAMPEVAERLKRVIESAGNQMTATVNGSNSNDRAQVEGKGPTGNRSSILSSVDAAPGASATQPCENPACEKRFPPGGGIANSPKRFCSDHCRTAGWIVRKAAALLVPLGKEKCWSILFERSCK